MSKPFSEMTKQELMALLSQKESEAARYSVMEKGYKVSLQLCIWGAWQRIL